LEIEAKYAIVGPLEPDALGDLSVAPFMLRWLAAETHRDTILDTAERVVTGSHHGLRVRRWPDQTVVTLKGGGRFSDGIHEREELEVPLPHRDQANHKPKDKEPDCEEYNPDHWPAPLRERVLSLVGNERLLPLFTVEVHRRTWSVERDGRVIGELAFDTGTITAGGRTEPIRELEVEIKEQGTRGDLEQLATCLQRQLPLAPEPRTKLQRGLALLDNAELKA
jgi:triphosphatase